MTVHVLLTADNHLDPSAVQYGPKRFDRKHDFQHSFEVLVNFALENRPDLFLIGGDFYDGILPGNPTRAYVSEQFKRLHEKEIKVVLISGHHDTPRSVEQGVSPLSVHAKTGHVYFLQHQRPTVKLFHFGNESVNVTGMSLNPALGPDQDPLAGQKLDRTSDVNIFLTHYPIEGFEGYFGQETHIGKSSIPRDFQLFASGHLHRHQKNTINGTPVVYPGSTERTSFNEEGEEKGFCWFELDKSGILNQEFHSTPARVMETLDARVTGEGGSLTRQIQNLIEKRVNSEKILKVKVVGRVSLEQLSTYKRSTLLAFCEGRFFHVEFDENDLNALTAEPLESLPRNTPLEELNRTFEMLLSKAKVEERPLVHEAWKGTIAKLQGEGVS
ncbi:MAG TPA: DNA repair exonuclease [Candidatus Bathyarchaeia archaeon]|nr:DNA repair exonuclease [Candidatus Bathyarchaeia archaeon]